MKTREQVKAMSPDEQHEYFRAAAQELMEKKGVRWQEACRQIKKRYPDAYDSFVTAGAAK